ncbi:MAG TPA: thiamine phosphate synthase [Pseudomonadales bacterium]
MTIRNRDFSKPRRQPVAWSIAGSDNSGGAGIQADNKSFAAFAVYGCNIIAAVTAQNSQAVADVLAMPPAQIRSQWQTLVDEYRADAIKLGMLANAAVIDSLLALLPQLDVPVVCDPVLIASNGGSLMESSQSYHKLLPQVDVLTPNEAEFRALFGFNCQTPQQLAEAALTVAAQYHLDLVITGGECLLDDRQAADCCVIGGELFWMHSPRRATRHSHGTGCSFSSALAAALALGYSRYEACVLAKAYINQGLALPDVFGLDVCAFQHTGFPQRLDCLPAISRAYPQAHYVFPRCDSLQLGLYPVVDSLDWLQRCLAEGVKTIQLRLKNLPLAEVDSQVAQAAALGRQYQARLFINDYWQLAIKHQAYGVHLGQEDVLDADLAAIAAAGLHLGISTHSWFEIAVAHSLQPSYIAIGPVYATTTKVMPFAPQGLEQLGQWLQLIGDAYPVVAIGGIDASNAADVLATGAGSIAMVRAITEAADYRQAIAAMRRLTGEAQA